MEPALRPKVFINRQQQQLHRNAHLHHLYHNNCSFYHLCAIIVSSLYHHDLCTIKPAVRLKVASPFIFLLLKITNKLAHNTLHNAHCAPNPIKNTHPNFYPFAKKTWLVKISCLKSLQIPNISDWHETRRCTSNRISQFENFSCSSICFPSFHSAA